MIRLSPRRLVAALALLVLSACAAENLDTAPEPLGDFMLGYTIIVADKTQMAGPSREATAEEWQAVLTDEIAKRTGRYDGNNLYHLGINVEAYALAYPGIPVVFNPKSVLVLSVNVWDDNAQRRINAEPRQIQVFEPFSEKTLVGSGLTQTKEDQMRSLSASAARQINDWLVENKAWFTPEAVAARALLPPQTGAVKPADGAAVPAAAK